MNFSHCGSGPKSGCSDRKRPTAALGPAPSVSSMMNQLCGVTRSLYRSSSVCVCSNECSASAITMMGLLPAAMSRATTAVSVESPIKYCTRGWLGRMRVGNGAASW
jgi:hypothetical protein